MQNGNLVGKASPNAKIEIYSDAAEEGEFDVVRSRVI